MGTPQDNRIIAEDLRREAAKPASLARRAKLTILAEQFDQLANEVSEIKKQISIGAVGSSGN